MDKKGTDKMSVKDIIKNPFANISPEESLGKFDSDALVDDTDVKNKFLTVHNKRVKDEITSDIRLARYGDDKDKKFINDMGCIKGDAIDLYDEYCELVKDYWVKVGKGQEKYCQINKVSFDDYTKGVKQKENKDWINSQKIMKNMLSGVFSRRIDWTTNLNINVPNNHLGKMLFGDRDTDHEMVKMGAMEREFNDMKRHFSNKEEQGDMR